MTTPDGCVILPVQAGPALRQLVQAFALEKGLRPKPISHVSLAKKRGTEIAQSIAQRYAWNLREKTGESEILPWDVVILERVDERKFQEHLRMSLHTLLYH